MPRKFKFAGTIDDNTQVLGTTHRHMKEILRAGFEQQFVLIREAELRREVQARESKQPYGSVGEPTSEGLTPNDTSGRLDCQ